MAEALFKSVMPPAFRTGSDNLTDRCQSFLFMSRYNFSEGEKREQAFKQLFGTVISSSQFESLAKKTGKETQGFEAFGNYKALVETFCPQGDLFSLAKCKYVQNEVMFFDSWLKDAPKGADFTEITLLFTRKKKERDAVREKAPETTEYAHEDSAKQSITGHRVVKEWSKAEAEAKEVVYNGEQFVLFLAVLKEMEADGAVSAEDYQEAMLTSGVPEVIWFLLGLVEKPTGHEIWVKLKPFTLNKKDQVKKIAVIVGKHMERDGCGMVPGALKGYVPPVDYVQWALEGNLDKIPFEKLVKSVYDASTNTGISMEGLQQAQWFKMDRLYKPMRKIGGAFLQALGYGERTDPGSFDKVMDKLELNVEQTLGLDCDEVNIQLYGKFHGVFPNMALAIKDASEYRKQMFFLHPVESVKYRPRFVPADSRYFEKEKEADEARVEAMKERKRDPKYALSFSKGEKISPVAKPPAGDGTRVGIRMVGTPSPHPVMLFCECTAVNMTNEICEAQQGIENPRRIAANVAATLSQVG